MDDAGHGLDERPPPDGFLLGEPGLGRLHVALVGGRRLPEGARFFCMALYDFNASTPEELTFKAGDMIAVVEYDTDGWGDGILGGVRYRQS